MVGGFSAFGFCFVGGLGGRERCSSLWLAGSRLLVFASRRVFWGALAGIRLCGSGVLGFWFLLRGGVFGALAGIVFVDRVFSPFGFCFAAVFLGRERVASLWGGCSRLLVSSSWVVFLGLSG